MAQTHILLKLNRLNQIGSPFFILQIDLFNTIKMAQGNWLRSMENIIHIKQ